MESVRNMTEYCIKHIQPPLELSYFTGVASIVLCCMITIGNGLIFAAVYKDPFKRLRTPFSYFLVNLAISDFIVGIVTMPLSVHFHFSETTSFGNLPKPTVVHVSFFVTSTASVLSMGALCFDRYLAVTSKLSYKKKLSRSRCISISVGIWIVSVAFTMIYFVVGYTVMILVTIHSIFFATLGLMVLTYVKVYKVLNTLSKELGSCKRKGTVHANRSTGKERKNNQKDKNVTQTFLLILLVFFVSFIPVLIFAYALEFCSSCSCAFRHSMRDLELLFVCLNSAINPIVCILRLRVYKKSVLAIFRCGDKDIYDFETSSAQQQPSDIHSKSSKKLNYKRNTKVGGTLSPGDSLNRRVSGSVRSLNVSVFQGKSQYNMSEVNVAAV